MAMPDESSPEQQLCWSLAFAGAKTRQSKHWVSRFIPLHGVLLWTWYLWRSAQQVLLSVGCMLPGALLSLPDNPLIAAACFVGM
jgi:hypothetical protein